MSESQRKLYVARYSTGEGVIGSYLFWSDGHFLDGDWALVEGLPICDLFDPAGGDILTVDEVETSLDSIPFIGKEEDIPQKGPLVFNPKGEELEFKAGRVRVKEESIPDFTCETDSVGTTRWKDKHRRLHRLEGPALTRTDGHEEWYKGGVHHCDGGPAISKPNGYRVYYRDGDRHRVGGPAVIHPDGKTEYWFEGGRVIDPKEIAKIDSPNEA